MAERTADIVVGSPTSSASTKVEFSGLDPNQKRARLLEVLERGIIGARMHVELPKGVYGEWIHNSPEEVYRMEQLGFKIDTEYAVKRRLHSEGDGKSIVGDVVYMVCDQDTKNLIDALKQEQFDRVHGKPGSSRKIEDTEFLQNNAGTPIKAINEGAEHVVSGSDIAQSLQAASTPS